MERNLGRTLFQSSHGTKQKRKKITVGSGSTRGTGKAGGAGEAVAVVGCVGATRFYGNVERKKKWQYNISLFTCVLVQQTTEQKLHLQISEMV